MVRNPRLKAQQRMAAYMAACTAKFGACTVDDLKAAGYDDADLAAHADAARKLAAAQYPDLAA